MTSPRPAPATVRSPPPVYFWNSRGRSSGATPLPSSETETWTPSRSAATRIGVDSGACRAASASRLLSTCTMRRRSAIRDGELDFLGADRLGSAQLLRNRDLAQGNLAAVGAAEGEDLQQFLDGASRRAQTLHDPPRLVVERHRVAGLRIEHRDADRGDRDQGFEIGPCAALVAVGAGVSDRGRGLRREQHQHFLVLVGEGLAVRLVGEKEAADVGAAVALHTPVERMLSVEVRMAPMHTPRHENYVLRCDLSVS